MRAFAVLVALRACADALSAPCDPPAATLRLLEQAPPLRDPSLSFERRVGALRALAAKHPDDFFIQRAYQDSFRRMRQLGAEFDRALAMYRARPEDPLSAYYEARLLMWADPERSRKTFARLIEAHPDFVWPRLELAAFATLPGARDAQQRTAHIDAFTRACPDAFAADAPAHTRAGLERRSTPLEAHAWAELWRKEEKSGASAEALAATVRADLKRIEAWPLRSAPELRSVYQEAARLLKDPSVESDFRRRVEREAPASALALSFVMDDWRKANAPPDRNATAAQRNEWRQRELQAYREWLRRWPESVQLLLMALGGIDSRLLREWPGTLSAADLELIDRTAAAQEKSPDLVAHWPPLEVRFARMYVRAGVRLQRVPSLLDEGLRRIEEMERYGLSRELIPEEMRARTADWRTITYRQAEEIRADYLLAVNRVADAKALVEQALARPVSPDPADGVDRGAWLRRRARVADAEGDVAGALAHYQASLAGIGKGWLTSPDAAGELRAVRAYYLAHGGTEQEFAEWVAKAPAPQRPATTPIAFVKAAPEFSAADLSGRVWTLASLKGKVTFVNYWATWCGPCRAEHPGLQELFNRVKGRSDVQMLTFSLDEDAAELSRYLKEKGYTFPVIRSREVADKLFPYGGIPANFLVNPQGMRTGYFGFDPSSESVAATVRKLEELASGR
jgi:thiol-disulfide isomerase/thioredoxin